MNRLHYVRQINVLKKQLFVIWYTNEMDGLVLNSHHRIETFDSVMAASQYALEHKISESSGAFPVVDLDRVAAWLEAPLPENIDCEVFLDAWNLFGDLVSSIALRNMDPEDTKHSKIYTKLFAGNNVPAVTPKGKSYEPIWSKWEAKVIAKVMNQGLSLFIGHLP